MSRTDAVQANEPAGTLLGLCLAGPTGAGKTALAMAFARSLSGSGSPSLSPSPSSSLSASHPSSRPGPLDDAGAGGAAVEIISVDSALVYRGMDIGTAKPSAAERAEVPHHLIDIRDPSEPYSAAAFAADAQRIAAEVRARGRLPLLVGGTMLYFKALREGLDAMPAADPAVRSAIEAQAGERGWPALHAELARVDPATARRVAPHDAQRIQRALEVWRISGRPLSAWQRGRRGIEASASDSEVTGSDSEVAGSRTAPSGRWPLVSLEPASRAWLHERITLRFDHMLEQGLLDEVRALRARGDLHPALPSMRCVGYRQAWAALESGHLEGLAAAGAAATRQLAKRQLTWLRSMPDRQVVPSDARADEALERGIAALRQAAQQGGWRLVAP